MTKFSKILTALATVSTLAVASVALPQQAEARWQGHGGWHGRAVGYGVGAFAAGALVGAAVANGPYYGYGPGYYAAGPGYYGGPACYWTRERVWTGYGWRAHRVQVCG